MTYDRVSEKHYRVGRFLFRFLDKQKMKDGSEELPICHGGYTIRRYVRFATSIPYKVRKVILGIKA